eukprot:767257-Hanusia_phi.AAC.1
MRGTPCRGSDKYEALEEHVGRKGGSGEEEEEEEEERGKDGRDGTKYDQESRVKEDQDQGQGEDRKIPGQAGGFP